MSEHLSQLLCDVIFAAMKNHKDPVPAAEKAAQAYKAGLGAFRSSVTPSATQPAELSLRK